MKVYYGKNFWGSSEQGTEMKEIRLNKDFVWEDISGFIPSLYICREGVALDICIRIPNEPVKRFWDNWHQKLGQGLSEEEQEKLSRENPLDIDFEIQVYINGEKLQNDFGCGACYTKAFGEQMEGSLEEQLFLSYGCDENASWVFKRHMCKWSAYQEKIKTIEIHFKAYDKPYPCEAIEIGLEDVGKEFEIVHPISKEHYTLYVKQAEQQELTEDMLAFHKSRHANLKYPTHYLTVSYYINPKLPEEAFLLESAGKGDKPCRQSSNKAVDIHVIGGTDGPTSLFIAGKRDRAQGRIAITALHFEPIESEPWRPVFMIKEREDLRLILSIMD